MWLSIADSFKKILEQNGLRKFSDFMSYEGGKVLKRLPSRTIRKLELSSENYPPQPPLVKGGLAVGLCEPQDLSPPYQGGGGGVIFIPLEQRGGSSFFFMKCHKGRISPLDALRSFLSGFAISWGRKEWDVIQAFHENGIPTLTAVAAGEKVSWLHQESFLITEELYGYQSLEMYLKSQFIPPLSGRKIMMKRAVLEEVADIARTMHGAGFNHRDFYCCHIFIKQTDDGQRQWRVLDLQRVDRRRWFRRRWIIKDLAALNYSAPVNIISRTDRLRFLRHYLGSVEAIRQASALLRDVVRKTDMILKHDLKLKKRKAEG